MSITAITAMTPMTEIVSPAAKKGILGARLVSMRRTFPFRFQISTGLSTPVVTGGLGSFVKVPRQ
jgi:hypothetical protein